MAAGKRAFSLWMATAALLLSSVFGVQVAAQVVEEDFESVTGTGGAIFLSGLGSATLTDWDDGIVGEGAYGETQGLARVEMSAQGLPAGGVGGTGGGELSVTLESFNIMEEGFEGVTGTGGGAFVTGDGVTPNVAGSTSDWDGGLVDETAFFVARSGAVLNGTASASGITSGGMGDSSAAMLSVTSVTPNGGSWYGGLTWTVPGFPGGSGVLGNPGFDLGLWDTIPAWDWWGDDSGEYQSVLEVTVDPHTGPNHLKVWGRAPGLDTAGVAQELRAEPGQTWELDVWTEHISGSDNIVGTSNYCEMRIEFYDGFNAEPIATNGAVILDGSSPTNVWIDNTPIQLTAPAGTSIVRAVVQRVSPLAEGGAVFFDTVSFGVVSGPPAFDLADYSLTADIKGDANTGAGETYGHYQLRVEDEDGNRLVFESDVVADGNWLAFGGPLDEAIEKNSVDVPTNGVFDPDSGDLTVVLIFDPDRSPSWGTGGTLTVDNLVLSNDRAEGSDWSGKLAWSELPLSNVIDPSYMMLSADIKGNTIGADYELRLDGYVAVPNIDEDFAAITEDTEVLVAGPGDSGGTAVDWNPEIDNEEAFFFTDGATVTETGGAWVRGLISGGYGDDGSCMQIEVLDVWPQETGKWFAGNVWRDQALPSTNLAEVTLTAKIKGTWNAAWLQEPSEYILRLEDADGDWIGFQGLSNSSYQAVGGALSGYDVSGFVDGSNGVFDLDTGSPYRVVVMFYGEGAPSPAYGDWGGTLTIDDVYLSPSPTPRMTQAGHVTFKGVADGTFQSVGGFLSEGESTWQPDGGQFYPEWGTNVASWDSGIEGESAFAGYGWGSLIETASAEGCATCGVGGSGGGVFTVTGIQSPPGWYWAGVAWNNIQIDMTDLSQVSFTIDGKGVWNAAGGESPGAITIRIEDAGGKRISWDSPAVNGNFNTLGGTLNTFTMESGFDQNSPAYGATIIVFGYRTPSWGTGATVYFDNVSVTDPTGVVLSEDFETVTGPRPGLLDGLESYAVTVAMENGVATWGDDASLVVDNLRFIMVPRSCDSDGDIDLVEFANFQNCFSDVGGGVAAGCECSDVDGDEDVDLDDYRLLNEFLSGPQS